MLHDFKATNFLWVIVAKKIGDFKFVFECSKEINISISYRYLW